MEERLRVKLATLTIAIALLMLLPSSAKADTFEYDYTSQPINFLPPFGTINIVFTITAPALSTSGFVTSFISTSDPFGTVAGFTWGPASAGFACGQPAGDICAVLVNTPPSIPGLAAAFDFFPASDFLTPGTSVGNFGATLVITDLGSAVPEPSSLLLLGSGLFGLLAIGRFGSRIRRDSLRSLD